MIAPDDFADLVQWTSREDARAIRDEHEMIDQLNTWERERRTVRALVLVRDCAILALVGGAWIVGCLLWGR
jgi:hypothetical protein